uniref:AlNc14C155G7632 protein n=1 Tax=Albugo laibachii Nc14 TaxID=890382 RepID=F0WMD3_9STRA|nr:AlNc14C155G7632 [Albugo laibachii Nc14]|eukprot:CCA22464.1 AlNc14C155G7632 [Albugo laibachii Nc14]
MTLSFSAALRNHASGQTLDENLNVEGSAQESDSCNIMITSLEIHAMKAVFGAAHIMEAQLSEMDGSYCSKGSRTSWDSSTPKSRSGQVVVLAGERDGVEREKLARRKLFIF